MTHGDGSTRPRDERTAARDPAAPTLCVLALSPQLTVTVEQAAGSDAAEIHVHPGGQGVWLASMAVSLGARVELCGPFGGETGRLAAHLAEQDGMVVHATRYAGPNGGYVHDRREGERAEVARSDGTPLTRHEEDDLFGAVLVTALDTDVVVLTGSEPPGLVPPGFFERLATDLRAQGRRVVADLSGDDVRAMLGPGVDVLKMSHSELQDAGFASGDDVGDLRAGAREVLAGGVGALVVSRAAEPTLAVTADDAWIVEAPPLTTVDHRGGGDSMTAGIAVGLARGLALVDAVRLGVAAGALNITRHGLGSGRGDQIERFADEVTVTPLDD